MRQGRESEANAAGFAYRAQKPLHTGVRTGLHYLISLPVCLPVCMCNFMVLTDYESCTRPMSIYLASMEASECELTRGTCCVARRLEVVAVAGLLWISWCVLGAAGFRYLFSFFFLRTHTACCKYEAALPHLPFY